MKGVEGWMLVVNKRQKMKAAKDEKNVLFLGGVCGMQTLVRYSRPMNSARSHTDITLCRFPDSEIDGSTLVNSSV
jgi:hypothetical protein